ncbi:benzaldehyde dehydrogenase [Wenjunlia vitaminophila]|uniref:Benzaldehyde dehydrogenase n=1 Tax=Wenjunlia vitaminophila TaxID=76728 RepID=A0A0T6LWG8_WENVI|nr:benzaldehyde dehydrogenase [Wenjunlia vitaminophila]KRV50459.1 benzaldehyde dehydrogenase [Wenjunlia vitaminophila]
MTLTAHSDTRFRFLNAQPWQGAVYIDGAWTPASGGAVDVLEKATGATLAVAGLADAADVARATASAAAAQPEWAATAAERRREVFLRAADVLATHHEELADWLIRETGGVRHKAEFELLKSRENLLQAAALTTRSAGGTLPSPPGVTSLARRVPRGVVGVITPWNFPLTLALRMLGPALALGNAVVLKPNPQTPVTGGVALARLFAEAGLPPGLLQVLPGEAEAGRALVIDRNVDMISFTGSTAVGRQVAADCAPLLKKCVLELGGNNPLVVLEDADLELASSAGAWGTFNYQGQLCMTVGRHVVHRGVVEAYAEKLTRRARALRVGDPARADVHLGPLVNENQVARVHRLVTESVAAGATLLTGGSHDGPMYQPTVLTGVTTDMPVFTEEIFGPVAPIIAVDSDDEAVAIANHGEYGLAAAVLSGSESRAAAIADRLRSGVVHVNDQTVNYDVQAPIGGMGASGSGDVFGGPADPEAYTEWQWITRRAQSPVYPF